MTTPQAGDHVCLHELEIDVRTELTLAETALGSLLGAVETLEQGGKGDR